MNGAMSTPTKPARVTVPSLRAMKTRGEKIAVVTCYDATFARLVDEAGVDVLLVGDSLGNVIQGHDTTLPVTVDDIIYHTRAVCRGTRRPHIVADMPFMSYQASIESGVANAGRLLKEGGAGSVKLEGGAELAELVHKLTASGIPVMGHIGLLPQSANVTGGHRVQGRDPGGRERLINDAKVLEQAGAYAVVMELMPAAIAAAVTAAVSIPTIGIGAGAGCDGQVLVIYDLLGMNEAFKPRFVRRFAQLGAGIRDAVGTYVREVRAGTFPSDAESFPVESDRLPAGAAPAANEAAYAAPKAKT